MNLSPDLVPFIADPGTSLVLARIADVQIGKPPSPDVERGTITCAVPRVFRSERLKVGDTIKVSYERKADPRIRKRNAFDQWNVLSLERGTLLLLACRPAVGPGRAIALAAIEVESDRSPEVIELERCLAIENLPEPGQKRQQLAEAIAGGKEFLRPYALDAIGRRGLVPPFEAVEIVDRAITSEKTTPDDDLDLARELLDHPFFDKNRGADRANQRVVASLVKGVLRERDPERRTRWIQYLASRVCAEFSTDRVEDRTIHQGLLRSISPSDTKELISTLSVQTAQAPPGHREIARDLLEILKTTSRPKP